MSRIICLDALCRSHPVATAPGLYRSLFVSQRIYRIQIGGANGRVKRAQRAAQQANQGSREGPLPAELKNQTGSLVYEETRAGSQSKPNHQAHGANQKRLALNFADDVTARSTHRLEDSD